MARPLLIVEMLSLPKQLSMHRAYSYDAELAQSSRQWIGSHIGLKANTVAYHLRPPPRCERAQSYGLAKRINYDEVLVLVTYRPCYVSMNGRDQNIAILRMCAGLDCRSHLCRMGIWRALF